MDQYLLAAGNWLVDHPTPPVLAAVGFAGWFVKRQLERQWSVDLERSKATFSGELEATKASMQREHAELLARHQRELEAYRVSLIADAERAKAVQDVAKSLALKVGERRFFALAELHDATAGFGLEVCAFVTADHSNTVAFLKARQPILDRNGALIKSYSQCKPFLSEELKEATRKFMLMIAELLMARGEYPGVQLTSNHALIVASTVAQLQLDELLQQQLHAYEAMVARPAAAPPTTGLMP